MADRYGDNGHVSTDPAILLKMMFLLFCDDIASERELMGVVAERQDYLWFLNYGLDDDKGADSARPRYHQHRAVDDTHSVITAVETTPGSIAENKKLLDLVEQHESHTEMTPETVVADNKYGTEENFVACQQRGLKTHLGDVLSKQNHRSRREGIFPESAFIYQPQSDTYLCPAGEVMKPRRLHSHRRTWEYLATPGVCAQCTLRAQCTRSRTGRTVQRHEHQEWLDRGPQAHSTAARKDRRRRQVLIEGSFADAANNHGFKRSRWRRLWRQQIQDWMIAAIQNIRILMSRTTAAWPSCGWA